MTNKLLREEGNRNRKLFKLAPASFRIYHLLTEKGIVVDKPAGKVPLPYWPDGRWCMEMAMYIKTRADENLSRYDQGGTLAANASELSHLVRYCHRNKVDFIRLTDNHFKLFLKGLSAEWIIRNGVKEKKRSDRTTLSIGRQSLNFLAFVGHLHGKANFLGPDGDIRATLETYTPKDESGRPVGPQRTYWAHPDLPIPSPERRRHPISDDYISRLRRSVVSLGGSAFTRKRRFVLLRLLEGTGARRIEIASLTVDSVLAAKAMVDNNQPPFLEMLTFKQRGKPVARMVPINSVDLDFLIEYIEMHRAVIVYKKLESDHGILLVSENTGKPIQPNTITLELHLLRKQANIKGKAHPHLFRHRYITNRLVHFMREHNLNSKDDYVKMLLSVATFKQKVMEYTGQRSMQTIDRYVDWAFFKMAGYDETVERADIAHLSEKASTSLEELELLQESLSAAEIAQQAMARLRSISEDLARGRRVIAEQPSNPPS